MTNALIRFLKIYERRKLLNDKRPALYRSTLYNIHMLHWYWMVYSYL